LVDDSKSADKIQKENLLAQKKKPIALLRNNVPPSLQNVERNRATACHEAIIEAKNARHQSKSSNSKAG
jgi:cyclin-A